MGGAVSSGRDNNELVDNLMNGNYIRTRVVERVFRVLDRADYMSAEARDQAYKDLAWRNGPLHLSAPCIYSEVMEALELKPGLSFLNVGSGTGYLSTLVGLIIGSSGTSHGVEVLPVVLEYANKKLAQFIENSHTLDEFDFCIPKYYSGNGLCLAPTHMYDRVYCGAGVSVKYETYFKQFIKVGGVLVMPLSDTLVQLRRVSEAQWTRRNLLNVSFARLRDPAKDELDDLIRLEEQGPACLQALARAAIRGALRGGVTRRQPELREPPPAPPPAPRHAPRRICIPYDATSDEELSELHDLDEAGGAHEMNALLSLVLSMGQNRAAGSLRFHHDDEPPPDDQQLGELFALEREDGDPDAMPDDGIIVFDMGVRAAMRARRRTRPRAHPRDPAAEPRDLPAEPRDLPAEPRDLPAEPRDLPAEPRDLPAEPRDLPAEPRDLPAEPRDLPAEPRHLPAEPRDLPADSSTEPLSTEHCSSGPATSASNTSTQGTPESPARGEAGASSWEARGWRAPPAPRRAAPHPSFWSELSSSEDDIDVLKDNKRQKLDSGIGEGTASSGASPDKSDDKSGDKSDDKTSPAHSSNTDDDDEVDTELPWVESSGECGSSGSGAHSEDMDDSESDDVLAPPPRLLRRKHCTTTTTLAQAMSRRRAGRAGRGARARCSRRGWCAPPAEGRGEGRRARLSLAMKRALKELPLPHALKQYLNYGRCYQI